MNKKFIWVGIVALVIGSLGVTPRAQTNPQFTKTLYRSAFAKEQVSVTTSSTALTSSVYNPTVTDVASVNSRAEFADIECDSHNVRVWMTGADPTASVGILFSISTLYTIQGYHDISNFRAISADGSNAACNVQYYRFASNTP
jgi:hypothetical protein